MPAVDIDAIRKRHFIWKPVRFEGECNFCDLPFPCDAIQLCDEVGLWKIIAEEYLDQTGRKREEITRLREALEEIRGLPSSYIDARPIAHAALEVKDD